jgi:hypothetical protein
MKYPTNRNAPIFIPIYPINPINPSSDNFGKASPLHLAGIAYSLLPATDYFIAVETQQGV